MASAMVVIVGDEDAGGSALDEGMGFVGPNAVDAVPRLTLAIDTTPIGPVVAGAVVAVPVTVTNPGDVPVSALAGLSCPDGQVAAGSHIACTVPHTVTQADLDAGGFDLTATVSGDWTGLPAEATDAERVPLVRSAGFDLVLAADIAEFDTVGAVIGYTATITNTGNQTGRPDTVTIDDVTLTCTPATDVAPGDTITCTGSLTTNTAADVTRTATATWPGGTTDSNPVTVTIDDGLAATGFAGQGLGLTGLGAIGFGALLWAFGARRRRRS